MQNKIKIERTILNLTQAELAEKISVSRQTIYAIESNKYIPSTILALKLSELFKKPVNDIFILEAEDY